MNSVLKGTWLEYLVEMSITYVPNYMLYIELGGGVVLSLFSEAFSVCWKFDNQIKQSSRKTTRIHMPKMNPLSLTLPVPFSSRLSSDCCEALGAGVWGCDLSTCRSVGRVVECDEVRSFS